MVKRLIAMIALLFLLIMAAVPAVAGEKEEIILRIQIVKERLIRLNDALYYIPFEKKVYEDALKELQAKQQELLKKMSEDGATNEK